MDVPRPRRRRIPSALWLVGLVLGALSLAAFGLEHDGATTVQVPARAVRIAEVERGDLVRSVGGRGALVPLRVRWLTANTAARVERLGVEPGAQVQADTVILELTNADMELAALQARSELAAARADLANLEASLETDRLGQKATVASVRADQREAERRAEANDALAESSAVSRDEVLRARDRAEELSSRLGLEQKRLGVLSKARSAQVTAQRARVEQLAAVVQFRDRQLDELHIKAGEAGVIGEIPVEVGQWVNPGTVLGRVVQPDRLKAELRIPEVRAQDLRVGQGAVVDTHVGTVKGHVARIDAAVTGGMVVVDVHFDEAPPAGVRPDQSVDGEIELEHLRDVLWVRRPAHAQPQELMGLFVVADDGDARRVSVSLGRASTDAIEVLEGLSVGDRVIVSDTNAWNAHDRISVQ
ncbi:MAG: HlyD family efflux transporter periplasmic adaptor subunit [Myxococcota bacterium]